MKSVIVFRHGKSDWSSGETNDHDRPLAPRGRKSAKLMGRYLRESGEVPDSVVISSALRAHDTAVLAINNGDWECRKRVTDRLYSCSPADVLREIRAEPDTTGVLMIVGHEPTCSEMIGRFSGQARVHFPTAAMARLDFAIERWNQADFGIAELVWLVTPKLIETLLNAGARE